MGDIIAENQFVAREMERRDFQFRGGQWVGGLLLAGDPPDHSDLEAFLRDQFRAQQAQSHAAAMGPGRTLGGK